MLLREQRSGSDKRLRDFVDKTLGSFDMRLRSRRLAALAALAAGGGFLLSGPNTGCMSFMGESLATATNFCFIFDCQNGMFSGTIDPCSGSRAGDPSQNLFADCQESNGP